MITGGLEAVLTSDGGTDIRVYSVKSEEEAVELCARQHRVSQCDTYEIIAIYKDSFYARFYGNHPFGFDILPDHLIWKDEETFRGDNKNAINPYCQGFAVCKIPFGTNLFWKKVFFAEGFKIIKWVDY